MQVWRTAEELTALEDLRSEGPLVLVPTMGALHEGHLSLVRHGRDLGPVVATIFVNPTQFGPGEDFDSYPRDLQADLALLEPLGVRGVFAPSVNEVYGGQGEVTVKAGRRAHDLCGAGRPGHFDGVLTVVAKLFGLVKPDVAIFGRKDAQQCLVIDQMVSDLKMGIRLVDAPTLREPEGLAMSSRNRYLVPEARERALALSRALGEARRLIETGERRTGVLTDAMAEALKICDTLEYAEVRSVPDLDTHEVIGGRTLLAVAARVEPARLIDNLVLEVGPDTVTEASLMGT
jgi:pantoate--beta-alanine ligase